MHPEISLFPSSLFYASKLLDGPDLRDTKKAVWHEKYPPYRFYNVGDGKEEKKDGGKSVWNRAEVDACCSLIFGLVREFPDVNFSNRIGGKQLKNFFC